jgi:hypothetical protein
MWSWIDQRTPVCWPTFSNDTIPEDGSVGGHFSIDEVCTSGRFIGIIIHSSLHFHQSITKWFWVQAKFPHCPAVLEFSAILSLPGKFSIIIPTHTKD